MTDLIIILVLLLIVVFALFRTRKHFKGGGCCGSRSNSVRSKKKLTEPKLGEKTLVIDGMHCKNCQIRVEDGLNRIDGVACTVNLRKKTAAVSYSVEVSDNLLKEPIDKLGYRVVEIR